MDFTIIDLLESVNLDPGTGGLLDASLSCLDKSIGGSSDGVTGCLETLHSSAALLGLHLAGKHQLRRGFAHLKKTGELKTALQAMIAHLFSCSNE